MKGNRPTIGYSRMIRLRWLDYTADMVAANRPEKEIIEALRNLLTNELSMGSDAKRGGREKTASILLMTWVLAVPSLGEFRSRGVDLWSKSMSNNRLALHWGMTLAAYPFFGAVAEIVGRLLRLQEQVAVSQIQRRVSEGFGQKETVARSVRRVLQSFADWGLLREGEHAGIYTKGNSIAVSNPQIIVWLVEAAMHANRNGYLVLKTIRESPLLFPFLLRGITPGLFAESRVIEVVRHGADEELIMFSKHGNGGT